MVDIVSVEGILGKGFGFVPKLLMQDTELTAYAKVIYCYISSYAGKGFEAFPSMSKMEHDLGINRKTIEKHRKILVDRGYIEVKKERGENGVFARNNYILCQTVPSASILPTDSEEKPGYEEVSGKQPLPISPPPISPPPVEPLPVKVPTNINSNNINNNNINNTKNSRRLDDSLYTNNGYAQKVTHDDDYLKVKTWYENNIQVMPSMQTLRDIGEWTDNYNSDLVIEAIKTAERNGARNFNYVNNTLRNWKNVHINTVEELLQHEAKRQNDIEKNKQRGNNGWNNQQSNQPVAKKQYKDGDIMPGGRVYNSIYDF